MKKISILLVIFFITGCYYGLDYNIKNKQVNDKSTINVNETIIHYFENIKIDINKCNNNSCKEIMLNIIDFIFYDKKINSIKYVDLNQETKKLIVENTVLFDKIIMSKYPNYKSDSENVVLTNFDVQLNNLLSRLKNIEITISKEDNKEKINNNAEKMIKKWLKNYRG